MINSDLESDGTGLGNLGNLGVTGLGVTQSRLGNLGGLGVTQSGLGNLGGTQSGLGNLGNLGLTGQTLLHYPTQIGQPIIYGPTGKSTKIFFFGVVFFTIFTIAVVAITVSLWQFNHVKPVQFTEALNPSSGRFGSVGNTPKTPGHIPASNLKSGECVPGNNAWMSGSGCQCVDGFYGNKCNMEISKFIKMGSIESYDGEIVEASSQADCENSCGDDCLGVFWDGDTCILANDKVRVKNSPIYRLESPGNLFLKEAKDLIIGERIYMHHSSNIRPWIPSLTSREMRLETPTRINRHFTRIMCPDNLVAIFSRYRFDKYFNETLEYYLHDCENKKIKLPSHIHLHKDIWVMFRKK